MTCLGDTCYVGSYVRRYTCPGTGAGFVWWVSERDRRREGGRDGRSENREREFRSQLPRFPSYRADIHQATRKKHLTRLAQGSDIACLHRTAEIFEHVPLTPLRAPIQEGFVWGLVTSPKFPCLPNKMAAENRDKVYLTGSWRYYPAKFTIIVWAAIVKLRHIVLLYSIVLSSLVDQYTTTGSTYLDRGNPKRPAKVAGE